MTRYLIGHDPGTGDDCHVVMLQLADGRMIPLSPATVRAHRRAALRRRLASAVWAVTPDPIAAAQVLMSALREAP